MKHRVVQCGWDPWLQGNKVIEWITCSCLEEAQVCACMLVPLTLKEVQKKCQSGEPLYKSHLVRYIIDEKTTIVECDDEE